MTIELETVCARCKAHISGPINQPKDKVSDGECRSCLKRTSPGAYYFSRRRDINDRLALGADVTAAGINESLFNGAPR